MLTIAAILTYGQLNIITAGVFGFEVGILIGFLCPWGKRPK